MNKPEHVKAFEYAQAHPNPQRKRSDSYDTDYADERLVMSWLSDHTTEWTVQAYGYSWQGKLVHVNYAGDVMFTIEVEPEPLVTFRIEAPYERFTPIKVK